MGAKVWQDVEVVAALIRLNDEGYSATLIAEGLGRGISRNAVIGKLHRLGISLKNANDHSPTHRKRRDRQQLQAKSPKIVMETLLEAKGVIPRNLSMMDLTRKTCRWPYGDPPYTFCGHQTDGRGPWCPSHAKLAWQPQRKNPPASDAAKGRSGQRAERQFHGS